MIEQLSGFRRQREEAKFVAFAMNAELGFGKQNVVPDSRLSTSAERSPCRSIKPDDGQVAGGAEAGPEARHFIDGKRHDVEPGLLHSQPADGDPWAAKAHRLTLQESVLKPMRDLTRSFRELVADGAIGDRDAAIDGGGKGRGC